MPSAICDHWAGSESLRRDRWPGWHIIQTSPGAGQYHPDTNWQRLRRGASPRHAYIVHHRKSQGWVLPGQCLQPQTQPWAAFLSVPNSSCSPCLEPRRQKLLDLSSRECRIMCFAQGLSQSRQPANIYHMTNRMNVLRPLEGAT